MSENVSAKYYWENKERLQIKAREKDQILFKEEKKKSNNMVMNVTKISQKMKNKRLMIIKKKYKMRKNTLLKESILI